MSDCGWSEYVCAEFLWDGATGLIVMLEGESCSSFLFSELMFLVTQ